MRDPRETLRRIADMGQKLYAYQAPTGYPDRAEAWVNTGSLASRRPGKRSNNAGRATCASRRLNAAPTQ